DLKVHVYKDYVQPNLALADKELDANFFQHVPYLENFTRERGLKLKALCAVHIEPLGVYSKRLDAMPGLQHRDRVAIPNDPANIGRALRLLAEADVIELREGAGIRAGLSDVVRNPKRLRFIEMEPSLMAGMLKDVAAAVIPVNFALAAGLNPGRDAIFLEKPDSPYANVLVVRKNEKRPKVLKLAEALRSPAVRAFILERYRGALTPAF
ncbi:MAG: methionine ABC transporter substrate-binding protein, partial [Duodenibacillus sp.]|nr:methionine ABC transporter substrate-binding protein [Duodenibacillus sp.]